MKEVVVIGGGIVGCCCAWYLQKAGMKVTIIDKGDFIDGCSFGNSGMIVPSHFTPLASPGMVAKGLRWMFRKDSPFYIRPRLNLELAQWLWKFSRSANKKHVTESASLLRDMHFEGHAFYDHLNTLPGFDFNFEKKGILMMYQSSQAEHEEAETAEMAFELGIESNVLSPIALKSLERNIRMDVRGAVHYPGDAHLAPHRLMQQLITQLQDSGVELIKGSEVLKIADAGIDGVTLLLRNDVTLRSRYVVLAAGSWSGMILGHSGFSLPMQDGKGYSMTFDRPPALPTIPAILTEARVAITPMGESLRVAGTLEISGMDHKISSHKVKSILSAARSYYPDLKFDIPRSVWHGYRPCTPDGLPYIGKWKNDSSIILATGHAMMGLSLAPSTARIVRDIIVDKGKNGPDKKLKADRFS